MFRTQKILKKRTFIEHELEFHKKFLIIWSVWVLLIIVRAMSVFSFHELTLYFLSILFIAALPSILLWNHIKDYLEYSKNFNLYMDYIIAKNKLMASGDFILIEKFVEKNIDYLSTYLDNFIYKLGRGTTLRFSEKVDEI